MRGNTSWWWQEYYYWILRGNTELGDGLGGGLGGGGLGAAQWDCAVGSAAPARQITPAHDKYCAYLTILYTCLLSSLPAVVLIILKPTATCPTYTAFEMHELKNPHLRLPDIKFSLPEFRQIRIGNEVETTYDPIRTGEEVTPPIYWSIISALTSRAAW